MRSHTMYSFKMLSMHQKSYKFISVKLKTEQYAKSDIINTAVHSSVHGFSVIIVIMLRTCRMKLLIALLMIGFLE